MQERGGGGVISLLAAAALASAAPAPEPQPLTIGETVTLEVLGAAREVNVIVPPDYAAEPEKRWPVIYLLDGALKQDLMMGTGLMRWGALWGRSRDAIIVGIETKDRQRELLPPTGDKAERERWPTAGESAAFRAWLAGKVKPFVEARYRHDGTAFLVGESAAGHFVAETWVTSPGDFDGYAALSPSFQWDNQLLSRRFAALPPLGRPPLFLSLADEGGATEEGALRFFAAAGPSVCFADKRGTLVRHSNTLHQLLPEAMQFLLPTQADWLDEYGFTVSCARGGD